MENKEIYINGVDVSGCINRNDLKFASYNCCLNGGCQCKDNPNCYYKQLKRKEQECEELKKIINEAKNSKLDLKSFLVGEAVQNEYEQQLDQLKAENDLAKQLINWILKFFELTDYDWQDDQNEISALIEDYIDDKNSTIDFVNDINKGLFKKLTEIKELLLKTPTDSQERCVNAKSVILQKISEVGNEN